MSEQKHHKPASPVSDSAVEHVRHVGPPDHIRIGDGRLTAPQHSDFAMQDVDEYRNSGPQGIMMPADNDLSDYASLDMNDFTPFFDFNSAASESKPSPNDLDFKNHIPQYQNTFSPSPFSAGLQLTPQTHIAHVSSRKRTREREDTDALGFSGGYTIEEDVGPKSPMVDVKKESSAPPAALTNSTDHQSNFADYMTRQADSPEDFNFEPPAHSPQAPIPQKGSTSIGLAVPNGAQYLEGTQCRLFMDFPKNTKASSSGFSYTSHDGTVLIKSRVETQIPVRFVLYPPSAPYEVLRLPRHTIAKVKFIEDGHPMSNPETLDLQATLVCASAMQERDQLERALHEARGDPIPDWIIRIQEHKLKEDEAKIEAALARPDGDSSPTTSQKEGSGKEDRKEKIDYSKPRYGAPVNICEQCMNRERKRASRKKNRKAEEEEMWARDEHRRIIVFNTNQVRAFEKRTALDRPLTTETQMRICCYCRHHGEKEGFR